MNNLKRIKCQTEHINNMKPVCQESGLFMARKKQKIGVVVHMNTNDKKVFDSEPVQLFWSEKIIERLQKVHIPNEDISSVLNSIVENEK